MVTDYRGKSPLFVIPSPLELAPAPE